MGSVPLLKCTGSYTIYGCHSNDDSQWHRRCRWFRSGLLFVEIGRRGSSSIFILQCSSDGVHQRILSCIVADQNSRAVVAGAIAATWLLLRI